MAERYDFYVHDNRKVTFNLTEPIMREDSGVTDFVFHIPKVLNDLEVSDWAWWFVFVNAKKEKYSIALTLSDDPESPLESNIATYTVDYAMSIKAGSVQFAFEAINAGTGGAIDNEWHTQSYEIKVKETLQGNQVEYAETESDIISALLEEVRNKVNSLVGGATPEVKDSIAEMTDHKKIYVLSTDGNWYRYNGTAWVSGGQYASGITIDPTLTQSGQAADAKETGDRFDDAKSDLNYVVALDGDTTGADYSPWVSGRTLNDAGKIGSSGYYSACPTFIRVPNFVDSLRFVTGSSYGAIVCRYSGPDENLFVDRITYTKNHGYDLDVSTYKYVRIAIGSTDVENMDTVSITASYPLKTKISGLDTDLTHLLAKALSTDNADAEVIATETDYDNLTTSGNYYCSSSASAQSMLNCPVNVAHRLIVFTTTSTNRLWQIIIPNANTDIYMRTNMGTWNEWNKIITSRNGMESYDVRVTSANYQTILPNLDEAKENIVYSIAPNTPIPNIPEGNYNVAGADQSYGVASGTLITLRGAKMGSGYEKFQLFMSAAGLPEGGTGSIINFRGCRYSGGTHVWDKWSKMGNGVNLRATNTFIQESRIQAGTAMFSDMNDAPNNTIVQIDLDAVSMLNNPLKGHSCVLITLCPSYISRHGMLQLCSGIEGGIAHLFFRYGWQNNPGEIRWAPWMEVNATEAVMPE